MIAPSAAQATARAPAWDRVRGLGDEEKEALPCDFAAETTWREFEGLTNISLQRTFFSRDGATGPMAPTRRYDAHDAAGARPHSLEGGQTHPRRQKRENDASSCRTETSHMRPTERMGQRSARTFDALATPVVHHSRKKTPDMACRGLISHLRGSIGVGVELCFGGPRAVGAARSKK